MSNRPKISIVMPAYNSERFVAQAIQSILDQSFKDFELVIVEDGSTDKTKSIIESFNDKRIVLIENENNLGLARALNIGVKSSHGEYIARMDSDDFAIPNRLEKQLNFLEENPRIGIVGSAMIEINTSGKPINLLKKPFSHIDIKWSSLFSTPMYHPTIFARTDILKNNPYDEGLSNSEDYELWSRLLFRTDTHFANIKEPLIKYRVYPESFTRTLNLDKRVLSAHNTIKNIEHYTELSQGERDLLVRLKQERNLSTKNLLKIIQIYYKTASNFIKKEHLGPKKWLSIYSKILNMAWFLLKYRIKQI